MTNISEIYDVIRNLRGKASEGFIRPTIKQFFTSSTVFENIESGPNPEYLTKILAPDGAANDWFGYSVAVSDTAIVVGAHYDDDNGSNSGSAYIFNTDGTYVTKITAPDGAATDYFGRSVATSDTAIVVGAYADDDKGDDSGSAYIWTV